MNVKMAQELRLVIVVDSQVTLLLRDLEKVTKYYKRLL